MYLMYKIIWYLCVEALIQEVVSAFQCVYFLPLLVQSDTAVSKVEEPADGDDGSQEEQKEQEVDKMEEGQGQFL